jgi:hypothetical protein
MITFRSREGPLNHSPPLFCSRLSEHLRPRGLHHPGCRRCDHLGDRKGYETCEVLVVSCQLRVEGMTTNIEVSWVVVAPSLSSKMPSLRIPRSRQEASLGCAPALALPPRSNIVASFISNFGADLKTVLLSDSLATRMTLQH